jgi:glycerophosphoryl diester phosphodiesterase
MSHARPGWPLVLAHRGASGTLPENTLPAYRLAVEQRADMIEIDLHTTRDGEIVITHDEDLSHLGREGEIADASLEEIRALDAGGGERVPTLDEVLDAFGQEIPFNLEIKRGTRGTYPGLEAAALQAVEGRGLLEETLFSSFFDPVLSEVRRISAAARIAVLVSPAAPECPIERAREVGAEAINYHLLLATEESIEAAHAQGLYVCVYTVDDERLMTKLLDFGADGLFTNYPARMRTLLDSRNAFD